MMKPNTIMFPTKVSTFNYLKKNDNTIAYPYKLNRTVNLGENEQTFKKSSVINTLNAMVRASRDTEPDYMIEALKPGSKKHFKNIGPKSRLIAQELFRMATEPGYQSNKIAPDSSVETGLKWLSNFLKPKKSKKTN